MFDISAYYPDFQYPRGYWKLKELNLTDFYFWYFIPENQLCNRINGLNDRYPKRKLIPFARRDDNDDIACFEIGKGEKVQIIHDYASQGYEQLKEYENIWLWVKDAFEELMRNEQNQNVPLCGTLQ